MYTHKNKWMDALQKYKKMYFFPYLYNNMPFKWKLTSEMDTDRFTFDHRKFHPEQNAWIIIKNKFL